MIDTRDSNLWRTRYDERLDKHERSYAPFYGISNGRLPEHPTHVLSLVKPPMIFQLPGQRLRLTSARNCDDGVVLARVTAPTDLRPRP